MTIHNDPFTFNTIRIKMQNIRAEFCGVHNVEIDFKNTNVEDVLKQSAEFIWGAFSSYEIKKLAFDLFTKELINEAQKNEIDTEPTMHGLLSYFMGTCKLPEEIKWLLNVMCDKYRKRGLRKEIERIIEELSACENDQNQESSTVEESSADEHVNITVENDASKQNNQFNDSEARELLQGAPKGSERRPTKCQKLPNKIIICLLSAVVLALISIVIMIKYNVSSPESTETEKNGESKSENGTKTTVNHQSPSDDALIPIKSVFEPEKEYLKEISNVQDIRHAQYDFCNKNSTFNTLRLNFSAPFKKNYFRIRCSENVAGLEISGPLTEQNIIYLLLTFKNVKYLSFAGKQICVSLEDFAEKWENDKLYRDKLSRMSAATLNNLVFMQFSNLSECTGLYKLVSIFLKADNLQTIVLNNVFISISNEEYLDTIRKRSPKFENFKFVGNLSTNSQLFELLLFWPALKNFHFEILSGAEKPNVLKTFKKILMAGENLQSVYSNVVLPYENYLTWLPKFQKMKALNLTILLNSSIKYVFDMRFFSKFPNAKVIDINFSTESESCKSSDGQTSIVIKIINLQKYVGRDSQIDTLIFTSRCKLTTNKGWNLPCLKYEHSFNRDSSNFKTSTQTDSWIRVCRIELV